MYALVGEHSQTQYFFPYSIHILILPVLPSTNPHVWTSISKHFPPPLKSYEVAIGKGIMTTFQFLKGSFEQTFTFL